MTASRYQDWRVAQITREKTERMPLMRFDPSLDMNDQTYTIGQHNIVTIEGFPPAVMTIVEWIEKFHPDADVKVEEANLPFGEWHSAALQYYYDTGEWLPTGPLYGVHVPALSATWFYPEDEDLMLLIFKWQDNPVNV